MCTQFRVFVYIFFYDVFRGKESFSFRRFFLFFCFFIFAKIKKKKTLLHIYFILGKKGYYIHVETLMLKKQNAEKFEAFDTFAYYKAARIFLRFLLLFLDIYLHTGVVSGWRTEMVRWPLAHMDFGPWSSTHFFFFILFFFCILHFIIPYITAHTTEIRKKCLKKKKKENSKMSKLLFVCFF